MATQTPSRLAALLLTPFLSLALLAGPTGCNDDPAGTEGGGGDDATSSTSAGGAGGGGTTNTGGAGGGGTTSTDTGGAGGGSTATPIEIELRYGSSSKKVNLAALSTQDFKGTEVVPLPVVWSTGGLKNDTSKLQFDFEGSDGFHPSDKSKCAAYITPAQLAQGYIVPETRSLVWEDALALSGCYHVYDVVKLIALDAP